MRLLRLATPDGWPTQVAGPPTYAPASRIDDATLGTAGVLLAAAHAHRLGTPRAVELAGRAAHVLLAEAEEPLLPPGVGWMQGAAGIAAYVFRVGRLLDQGVDASTVPRPDSWWALQRPPS